MWLDYYKVSVHRERKKKKQEKEERKKKERKKRVKNLPKMFLDSERIDPNDEELGFGRRKG